MSGSILRPSSLMQRSASSVSVGFGIWAHALIVSLVVLTGCGGSASETPPPLAPEPEELAQPRSPSSAFESETPAAGGAGGTESETEPAF